MNAVDARRYGARARRAATTSCAALCAALCALVLFFGTAQARNGAEALNHYGLVTLSDKEAGARIAARFKARGQPVFLVHDLNAGLSQNDIMRFADKAVLVDGDVWSTLQAEGALEKLRAAPLVRVLGRATVASWEQRANLVGGERQRKAYKVGAELLRVLEENFGSAPQGEQMTVIFERNHLTLLAPTALLDQLKFSTVRKVQAAGKPLLISPPPDTGLFAGRPFSYRVWAADPTDPSGELTYRLSGTLPPGLEWNGATHTLSGTPVTGGSWRLAATVQNRAGLRDTLPFTLRFRVNREPLLAGAPPAIAVAGREWRFHPVAADPDHPGYDLNVRHGTLPAGMTFDPDSLLLRWIPPTSLAGTRHDFTLGVSDPLGARADFRYTVQVVAKEGMLLSEGVRIDLPWDTLVRGRSYTWSTRATASVWADDGIYLQGIKGDDSTLFRGEMLRIRPTKAGLHHLEFQFSAQGKPLAQSLFLPVRDDLPPEFVTELGEWRLQVGDPPRRYRPVAIDPEGEPVTMTARLPAGSAVTWDGKRLGFDPSARGMHAARLVARDAGGNTVDQWVIFQAEPVQTGSNVILEHRMHGEATAMTATMDFGTGRVGIYSPNFTYGGVPKSYWMFKETPYLFVGGNLTGRKAAAQGRAVWADLGLNFGAPAPGIVTGGIYTRVNAAWRFPNSPISEIEMEVTGHVHRAMLATDSSTFFHLMADTTDIISRSQLSEDGTLSRILRDGFRGDNIRIVSRVEAMGPLGYGFYAGPSVWREDQPLAEIGTQRFGGALRYRYLHDIGDFHVTARLGWSPDGEGWGAFVSTRLAFAAPF